MVTEKRPTVMFIKNWPPPDIITLWSQASEYHAALSLCESWAEGERGLTSYANLL